MLSRLNKLGLESRGRIIYPVVFVITYAFYCLHSYSSVLALSMRDSDHSSYSSN